MNGEEALVENERVGRPGAVRLLFHLRGESLLVRSDPGNLAAQVEPPLFDASSFLGAHDLRTRAGELLRGRDFSERQDPPVRHAEPSRYEHAGVHVGGDESSAPPGLHRGDGCGEASRVVPVSVRERDRVYRAEVESEPVRVALEGRSFRSAVEEDRASPAAEGRPNHERKSPGGAADGRARHRGRARSEDVGQLRGYGIGNRGEEIESIVHHDGDFE